MRTSRLTKVSKIGYGAGSFLEAGLYNFSTSFLLIYLTTVAGLQPNVAGIICSLSVLMEAISGVIVGHVSDQSYTKFGRRRPFIIISGISGCILLCLLFMDLGFPEPIKTAYYFIVATLYWASYAFFYIPYTALGAEISGDYGERQTLRSYCRVFAIVGNLICTVCPLWVMGMLKNNGATEKSAWFIFAVAMGIVTFACCIFCWKVTRGLEPTYESKCLTCQKKPFMDLIKDYKEIFELKCFSRLVISRTIFLISYSCYSVSLIYYMKYREGLDDSLTAGVFLIGIIASFVYTPFIEIATKKIPKQSMIVLSFFLAGIPGIGIFMADVTGPIVIFVYVCLITFAYSCFWQISYSMFYDITEVDEFKNGKRREGSITSLMSLLGTFAVSITFYLVGTLLDASGFGVGTLSQSPGTITMISGIFILIPCILLIFAGTILLSYPMNKKRFAALKEAIYLKAQGKDTSELEKEIEDLY